MDTPKHASFAGLVWAVAVAALLQGILLARLPTVSADGIIFISVARDLAERPVEALRKHDQHPGYPAMILAGTRVVQALGFRGDPEAFMIAGQVVSFICGLLSVVVVWFFARDLFGVRVANIAALIFAVLPIPRAIAADAQSDTPHVLFYLLAAWLASAALVSGQLPLLAAAGCASGIAYWIRPEGAEILLVALPCLLVQAYRLGWPWRRLALASATLVGSALLVALPYPLLAGKITSKQVPFAKTQTAPTFIAQQAETHASSATLADAHAASETPPAAAFRSPMSSPSPAASPSDADQETVTRHYSFALAARVAGQGAARLLVSIGQGFKFVFVPFYLVSWLALVRCRPDWMRISFIALLAGAHIAALLGVYIISGYIAHRHVIPLVGLAMPFTALGVVFVADWLALRRNWQPAIVTAVMLGATLVALVPFTLKPLNREFIPVIEAVRWVQQRAEPGAGVVSNSPYPGFYGHFPIAFLYSEALTLDAALEQAEGDANYDFVILHVGAHDYHPEWIEQLDRFYRPVHEIPDPLSAGRPKKVVIFQAKDGQGPRVARRGAS